MTLYELMLRTNHHLLCNRKPYLTDTQKIYIVKRFLSAQSSREECQRVWQRSISRKSGQLRSPDVPGVLHSTVQ